MAEIKVGKGGEPSQYTNHVMVRMSQAGTYQVSGVLNFKRNGSELLLSRHFTDMGEAMDTAVKWAGEHGIADIHIYALDMH